jgi:hypothetical protein
VLRGALPHHPLATSPLQSRARETPLTNQAHAADAGMGRNHTTLLHAVRKIGGDRTKDTGVNQQRHVRARIDVEGVR